jgi:hypothetical protein
MPKWLLIDQLNISIRVKPDAPSRGIRRALASTAFVRRLRVAVRSCVDRTPALRGIRVTVQR